MNLHTRLLPIPAPSPTQTLDSMLTVPEAQHHSTAILQARAAYCVPYRGHFLFSGTHQTSLFTKIITDCRASWAPRGQVAPLCFLSILPNLGSQSATDFKNLQPSLGSLTCWIVVRLISYSGGLKFIFHFSNTEALFLNHSLWKKNLWDTPPCFPSLLIWQKKFSSYFI